MKTIAILMLLAAAPVFAQTADLSPSVSVSVPTATKMQIIGIDINPMQKTMAVTYRWIDSAGRPIYAPGTAGKFSAVWTCTDDDGVFSSIFGFTIRSQDVGTTLGKGMRALIIAKMKQDIPALNGVTVTFND